MGNNLNSFCYKLINRVICWYNKQRLVIFEVKFKSCGTGFYAHEPYVISSPENIEIGNNVKIGSFVQIWGDGGVRIGDDCMIASHVTITSITHSTDTEKFNEINKTDKVIIGKNVWVGTHAIILPGVKIGDNSVIGAGTLVNKNVEPNSICIGIPGKSTKRI